MQIQATPRHTAGYHSIPHKPGFAGGTSSSVVQPRQNALHPIPQHPSPRFGQQSQNSSRYSALYTTLKRNLDLCIQKIRKVVSALEYFKANLHLGFAGVGCLLTFFPVPETFRRYIERNAFFSPTTLCHLSLLKDKTLEPKISEYTFNMSRYRATLQKAGLVFNPAEDTIRLHAWHIPAKLGKPTVLFNHGRGHNISQHSSILRVMSDAGYGIFVYNSPGFGQSQGQPGEDASYKAGLAASKYMETRLRIPQDQQIVMGNSMGSAIATDVAYRLKILKREPKALVLINTFPSIKETFVYRRDLDYPWTKSIFKEDKIKLEFNSAEKLKSLKDVPILIMQGDLDTYTPLPLVKKTMVDAPALQKHDITFKPLKGTQHRLLEKDYQRLGRYFFEYMDHHFQQGVAQ